MYEKLRIILLMLSEAIHFILQHTDMHNSSLGAFVVSYGYFVFIIVLWKSTSDSLRLFLVPGKTWK